MTQITWGNPYRGLCRNSSIALPNGASRACPQPWGETTDDYGQTLLQRGPGAYVVRSPGEAARDTELGYTWRTDALLAGSDFELYGQVLGGYIYCAPDGSRWHIAAMWPTVQAQQPLTVSITATRFGEFDGAAPVVQNLVATLADIGQAEPDPAKPVSGTVSIAVCDLQPDGSRALLMLYLPFAVLQQWGYSNANIGKRPLGWLELTLSGGAAGLSASLVVVRTRAQALGMAVIRESNWSGSGQLTLAGLSSSSVDMGDYTEVTYTYQPGLGETFGYHHLAADNEISLSSRILALWYAGAGFEELTLDYSWTETGGNAVPQESTSGQRVEHRPKSGGTVTVVEDSLEHSVSRSGQLDGTLAITLRRGAEVVAQITGAASNVMALSRVLASPSGASQSWTETGSGTLDSAAGSIAEVKNFDANTPFFTYVSTSRLAPQLPEPTTNLPRLQALAGGFGAELYMTDWQRTNVAPRRYSNNLLGLLVESGPYDFDAAVYHYTRRTTVAAYPGGSDAGGLAANAGTAYYGSYNPATGAVIRDQTEPVCWI